MNPKLFSFRALPWWSWRRSDARRDVATPGATPDVAVVTEYSISDERSERVRPLTGHGQPLFVNVAHWLVVATMFFSIWSGFNLARDQRPWLPLAWLPGMQAVPFWHVLAASMWLAILAAYVFFVWKKKPALASRTMLQQAANLSPKQASHRRSRHLIYAATLPLFLTGLILVSNAVGDHIALVRGLHLMMATAFIAVVLWHAWVQWKIGAWKRMRSVFLRLTGKTTSWKNLMAAVSGLALFGVCALALLTWWQSSQVLVAPKISGEITIDGDANEAQWKQAGTMMVSTHYGMNEKAHVPVEIKMMNDGYSLYIHAKWPDASKSQRHLPLIKTAQGWRVQQTHYLQADESQFYEDKFAVMLGGGPWDALRSVFLSNGAIRGGHRTSANQLLDIWHWKSVRNYGFANLDDAYFSVDAQALPGQRRYPWGYGSDPLLAGSYVENWDYFLTDTVRPLRLPRKPEMLNTYQHLSPIASNRDPVFGMHWVETQPYHESLDTYPVGTVMPSVVWFHPNEGDRADVRAAGVWKDGYWHLEMARNFETDSDYDRWIEDGIYLWFSSFDHSQTRHTYHLRPVRLKLGK